jgi:hypothetical protein
MFFSEGLDHPNQLELFRQISFYAHPVFGKKQPERSVMRNVRNRFGPSGKSFLSPLICCL